MEQFFHVSSSGDDLETVLQACLQQLPNCPEGANLGFIYVSDAIADALNGILHHCKITSGIEHWVGALGVGIIGDRREIYDQPAISLLLCQFDDEAFHIIEAARNEEEIANNRTPQDTDTCFAFIHADGYQENTQQLITALASSMNNCFIAGGYTSSRSKQLHVADEISFDSLSGVVFSGNVPVITNLSQGCSPLGDRHAITQSEKNVALSLDHRPALDVLYDDIGEVLSRDIASASAYILAGLCIPGSDNNDYLVRALVGIDEKQKIFAVNDLLGNSDEMLFCRRDGNTATQDMMDMLTKLKKRLDAQHIARPRGGVYVSCLGRGREQFGDDSEEVRMIHEVLGDFPLTGFFANGEIHNNRVYGYTGVLTLFL